MYKHHVPHYYSGHLNIALNKSIEKALICMASCFVLSLNEVYILEKLGRWCLKYLRNIYIGVSSFFKYKVVCIYPHSEVLSRSERLLSVLVEIDENKSKVTKWLFLLYFTQLSRFIFLSCLCLVIY